MICPVCKKEMYGGKIDSKTGIKYHLECYKVREKDVNGYGRREEK